MIINSLKNNFSFLIKRNPEFNELKEFIDDLSNEDRQSLLSDKSEVIRLLKNNILKKSTSHTGSIKFLNYILNEKEFNIINENGVLIKGIEPLLLNEKVLDIITKKYGEELKLEYSRGNPFMLLFEKDMEDPNRLNILNKLEKHLSMLLKENASFIVTNLLNGGRSKAIPWILEREELRDELMDIHIIYMFMLSCFCYGVDHEITKKIKELPNFTTIINKKYGDGGIEDSVLISLVKDFDTRNTDIDIFEDKKKRFQSLFVELMELMTNQMGIMDLKGFLPGFILMKDNVMDAINKIDYLAEKNFLVLFNSPDNSCNAAEFANDFEKTLKLFEKQPQIFFDKPEVESSNSTIFRVICNLIKIEEDKKGKKLSDGFKEIFTALLESGYEINFAEKSKFSTAISLIEICSYKKELLRLIIEKRPEVFDSIPVMIHSTLNHHDWKSLKFLSSHKNYKPNIINVAGFTPLQSALIAYNQYKDRNKKNNNFSDMILSLIKKGEDPLFDANNVDALSLYIKLYFDKYNKSDVKIDWEMESTEKLLTKILIIINKDSNITLPDSVYNFYVHYLLRSNENAEKILNIFDMDKDKQGLLNACLNSVEFLKNYIIIKPNENGVNTSYFSDSFTSEKSLLNVGIFDNMINKYEDILLVNKNLFIENINMELIKQFGFLNNYSIFMEKTISKLEKDILMDINRTGLKNTEKRRL